eukprot:PhM_4_TR7480/c0_g2_i1/m.93931
MSDEVASRPTTASKVYKVMPLEIFEASIKEGKYTPVDKDATDGFIHFSSRPQLIETLCRYFTGRADIAIFRISIDALYEHHGAFRDDWTASRKEFHSHLYGCALPLGDEGVLEEVIKNPIVDADTKLHVIPE